MQIETVICQRCGQPVPRYNVQGAKLCTDCYREFLEFFRDFLNEGVDHEYMNPTELEKAYKAVYNDLMKVDFQKEWGRFGIYKKGTIIGEPRCDYKYGEIVGEELPAEYLDAEIEKVTGYGGWTFSDFMFYLKEGEQMKEYTIIYDAEITEVIKGDEFREIDKAQLAAWIESKLGVDDVHVKGGVKVFEREL